MVNIDRLIIIFVNWCTKNIAMETQCFIQKCTSIILLSQIIMYEMLCNSCSSTYFKILIGSVQSVAIFLMIIVNEMIILKVIKKQAKFRYYHCAAVEFILTQHLWIVLKVNYTKCYIVSSIKLFNNNICIINKIIFENIKIYYYDREVPLCVSFLMIFSILWWKYCFFVPSWHWIM